MRRLIVEYWSNRRVLWQQYSSSHNSQYRRRFYRLLADSRDQSLDSVEIDLNRCIHECRFRCSAFNNWSACMRFFLRQMSLQMRHLEWFLSTSASIHRRSSRFSCLFQVISWLFFNVFDCDSKLRNRLENFVDFIFDFFVRFSFNRANFLDQIIAVFKQMLSVT